MTTKPTTGRRIKEDIDDLITGEDIEHSDEVNAKRQLRGRRKKAQFIEKCVRIRGHVPLRTRNRTKFEIRRRISIHVDLIRGAGTYRIPTASRKATYIHVRAK